MSGEYARETFAASLCGFRDKLTDIFTAFWIGMATGGLSCFSVLVYGSIRMNRKRATLAHQFNILYNSMRVGEVRTIKLSVEKTKKNLFLRTWAVISDLY